MARLGSALAAVISLIMLLSFPLNAQTGTWVKMNLLANLPAFEDIDMFDENHGIAVGGSDMGPGHLGKGYSGVCMTSDGGATWWILDGGSTHFNPELPDYAQWHAVHVVDHRRAWIVGDSALVYWTMDRGMTWEEQIVDWDTVQYRAPPTLYDIYMIDTQNGVAVGGDGLSVGMSGNEWHSAQIFRTHDGGLTWNNTSPQPSSINYLTGAIRCVDYNNGTFLYGGEYGLLLLEQGMTLQVLQPVTGTHAYEFHWWDVDIRDQNEHCFVGTHWWTNSPAAFRSVRQGSRYATMVPGNIVPGVTTLNTVHFLDPDNGWIAASQQYLALSNDSGVNWRNFKVGTIPPNIPVHGLDMVNSLCGYAVGGTPGSDDGFILRFYGAPPKADISTSEILLDFGTVECERIVEKDVFLRNSGTGNLVIQLGNVAFGSADFSVANTQDFPLTIRPGRSASIRVRWRPSPTQFGDVVSSMTVSNNDPDHNPWQIELRAKRNYGRLELLSEYSLSYGTCVGDTLYVDVPVHASGNRAPTFISVSAVSGHDEFRVISPAPGTVINDYASINIRFAPQDSAMRRGVYRVVHGNPTCPDTTLVAFSGVGQITAVQASATTIDFGQICVGLGRDTTITLRNLGNTYATVGVLEHVSGTPMFESLDFSVFLQQDSSQEYRLRFTPLSPGTFEARYRLVYGLCTDTLLLHFKGEGLETTIAFDPKSPVRIGPIFANRVAGQGITITNSGTTPARITDIQFSKMLPSLQFSSKPGLPLTLAPGQSTSVGVRFSPTTVGEFNTSVVVRWDARCGDTAAVEINAICVPNPAIEAPTTADLGIQRCPQPIRDTIMIQNSGNGPLVFYSASVSGADFTHFRIVQPNPDDTAKANSAYPLIVEFNRPTAGVSNAILRLTHNDFEAGRTDIAVTATRTVAEFAVEGDSSTAFFTRLFVPEQRVFTIRNVGTEPVTVTALRVVKAASVFSTTPVLPLPVAIATGEHVDFQVTFNPNARGPFHAVIEIETDPCANIHTLALTGTGDTDGLSADRGDVDFALDPCSFTEACEIITLKNQSPESVEVLSVSITQAGSTFTIDPAVAVPFTLGSNDERGVRVCASPTVRVPEQATLVITSNDPVYPTLTVALRASRDSSGMTVSESAIDFGRLAVCQTTTPRRITITNTGALRETVEMRFAHGGTAFSSTMPATETINAGRTFGFDVDFSQPGYGSFDDEIIITSQRCGTEYRIALHAELVRQEYIIAPDPLNFPTVSAGGTSTRQFTIQNAGGFDATIARIDVTPGGTFSVSGPPPTTIAAGGSENITLRFNPATEGSFSAAICVIIDAPCPDTLCITAAGDAVRGTLTVHPPLLAFGTRAQCEPVTLFDTLRNSGSGPITMMSATITGTAAAAYTNLTPVTVAEPIAAGAIRIFEIRYDPAMAPGDGPVTAALTVRTDDVVLPRFDIPLEAGRVTLRADAGGTVDFGPVQIGNPEVRTVTLRNDGSTPLCYTTADLPAELMLTPVPPFCIEPGATQELTLTFTTTTSGMYSGRFVLHVDAPCTDSTIFTLTARGEQGTLTQVDTIDLGVSAWCQTGTAQFGITSSYLEAVVFESVRLEGPDAAFFSILAPDPATLPRQINAGSTLDVIIELRPEATTRDYHATFISTFTAFGSTIERRTVLRARRVLPTITVTSADFPATVLGQSGGTRTVTITNSSELPLTVDGAVLSSPDFILRGLAPAAPAVLQPGEAMQATVEFIPQALGARSGTLTADGTLPCPFSAAGALTGIGIAQPIVNAVLSLDALHGAADALIDIPIRTDKDLGAAGVTGWTGQIRFNRSMLWPMEIVTAGSLSSGMQVHFTYDNAGGEVTMTATGGMVGTGPGVLAWLRCRVLVGNALSTPLRMSDDFRFTGGYATVAGRVDGSFELIDYCLPDDRLVNVDGAMALRQNTPNPVSLGSRGTTSISFSLPTDATISLDVYDMIGRHIHRVDQGLRSKGTHTVLVNVGSLRPGTYIYVLRTASDAAVRRMVVVP
ncbi:MAG: choice-of-anchor D domain-containing protein [Bacteroidota bacterium]|jgi:hypothetical protein|nr:choice-of-anchor D domain-containing protein [Bacteroidota bacterium]